MILRFDNETIEIIREIEKSVAKKLGVRAAYLCIATHANRESKQGKVEYCFETNEDDVFAILRDQGSKSVLCVLSNWMENDEVEWHCEEDFRLSLEDLQALEEITYNENTFLNRKLCKLINKYSDEQ